jgi:hypothetical protein
LRASNDVFIFSIIYGVFITPKEIDDISSAKETFGVYGFSTGVRPGCRPAMTPSLRGRSLALTSKLRDDKDITDQVQDVIVEKELNSGRRLSGR